MDKNFLGISHVLHAARISCYLVSSNFSQIRSLLDQYCLDELITIENAR